jgi:hypothetical protein
VNSAASYLEQQITRQVISNKRTYRRQESEGKQYTYNKPDVAGQPAGGGIMKSGAAATRIRGNEAGKEMVQSFYE